MHRTLSSILVLVVLVGVFAAPLCAQAVPANSPSTEPQAVQPPATPAAVTQYILPPDLLAKSKALYTTRTVMHFAEALYGIALLLAVLAFRIGPRFRDWAERASRFRLVQVFLFTPLLIVLLDALSLPFSVYGQHVARHYGLSVQGWRSWFWDWTKGEMVSIVIMPLLVFLLYALVRHSPKRWWLYMWMAITPIMILVVFLYPYVIEPMFNKFEPLMKQHSDLVAQIEKVTARGGLNISPDRMYLMKASEKYTTANAYVSGIGASKRVVVWDTTTRQATIPETLFIFGHEMGHYVLHHLPRGIAFASAGMLLAFGISFFAMRRLLARFGPRWHIRDIGDWASLPAFLLVFSVIGFFAEPISATLSRYQEHQADIYGLNVIEGIVPNRNQVAAHAFQVLGEHGLAYPYPNRFLVFWTYSHPSVADRVAFAATYQENNTR